jgi:hypothetical protein
MQPESQIPDNPATRYFLSAIIANRNVLDMGIHLALEGRILGKPKEHYQVVNIEEIDGMMMGFALHLN